jgi:competence ComEA-like helix-hairpin-helix protein
MMQVALEVTQNGLILLFRIASVLFLLSYPLIKIVWRLATRPWLTEPISQGVHLTFTPLRHLSARVYTQSLTPTDALSHELDSRTLLLPPPDPSKSDLNDATVEELRVVEGVGFVKALEIVEYRERYGDYRRIEELGMIPGIGAKTLHVLAEQFEVKANFAPPKVKLLEDQRG